MYIICQYMNMRRGGKRISPSETELASPMPEHSGGGKDDRAGGTDRTGEWRPFVRLGEKIQQIRQGLGMNQSEFAAALGRPGSQGQVSRWEQGRQAPPSTVLAEIARLGETDVEDLLELMRGTSTEPEGVVSVIPDLIDPDLARRLVHPRSPADERTRLWIVNQIESAYLESGIGEGEWPRWLRELRVLARSQ
jgi:transcriptional regulator with XRE-family HTH domain